MNLDCGIPYQRLATWLDDELALPCSNDCWTYCAGDASCRVTLTPLENRTIGLFDLERTQLSIEGDDEAVDEFYRLFVLRFVSAGG